MPPTRELNAAWAALINRTPSGAVSLSAVMSGTATSDSTRVDVGAHRAVIARALGFVPEPRDVNDVYAAEWWIPGRLNDLIIYVEGRLGALPSGPITRVLRALFEPGVAESLVAASRLGGDQAETDALYRLAGLDVGRGPP